MGVRDDRRHIEEETSSTKIEILGLRYPRVEIQRFSVSDSKSLIDAVQKEV